MKVLHGNHEGYLPRSGSLPVALSELCNKRAGEASRQVVVRIVKKLVSRLRRNGHVVHWRRVRGRCLDVEISEHTSCKEVWRGLGLFDS